MNRNYTAHQSAITLPARRVPYSFKWKCHLMCLVNSDPNKLKTSNLKH